MFHSILYPTADYGNLNNTEPSCFQDINLDQIFRPLCLDKKEFKLEPYFYTPLRDLETVYYRQAVLQDIEDTSLLKIFDDLSCQMNAIAGEFDDIMSKMQIMSPAKWRENYIARGRLVNSVDVYCDVVTQFADTLSARSFESDGIRGFSNYISDYTASEHFVEMRRRIGDFRKKLKTVKYTMLIKENSISIRKYDGEVPGSDNLLTLLEKFRQKEIGSVYLREIPQASQSDKVESSVFKLVMQEFQEVFSDIDEFCEKYTDFTDDTIVRAAREIQFYIAWHRFTANLKSAGLNFCYPKMLDKPGDIYARDTFNPSLAYNKDGVNIVTNDFDLKPPEQIIVITGPNQGGKTTFARMFGQIHYLASLGLCVPGTQAQLFLCDKILTHFSRQENFEMHSGQLQDDLLRLKAMFDAATSDSILIINEIFASTTNRDALVLGGRMMDKLTSLRAPSLVITFLDELADHGAETISMVSSVRADDPTARTYKIIRKKPDGLAFAIHLAKKRNMTYDQIIDRMKAGGDTNDKP